MLAIVEQDQQILGAEELDDALLERRARTRLHTQRCHHDLVHRVNVSRRCELTEPRTVGKPRQHVGGHLDRQTRLSDAPCARDRHHPDVFQRGHDPFELRASANERGQLHRQVARVGVERTQRREVGRQVRVRDLDDALRSTEVAQSVLAEIAQRDLRADVIAHEIGAGGRRHDLSAVRRRGDASGTVHRRAVVVAVTHLRHPGVQTHPDLQRLGEHPLLAGQRALRVDRSRHCVGCSAERSVQAIAGGLHHMAVALLHRASQDLVVARQRIAHRLGMLLPEAGRALEIGEQERHRPRREVSHPSISLSSRSISERVKSRSSSVLIDSPRAIAAARTSGARAFSRRSRY